MKLYLLILVSALFFLGYPTSNEEVNTINDATSYSFGQLYLGDRWTMIISDEMVSDVPMILEVMNTNEQYNNIECYNIKMTGSIASLDFNGIEMRNAMITAKLFARKSDFEPVWSETSVTGTFTDELGSIYPMEANEKMTYNYTGGHPSIISLGENWSVKENISCRREFHLNDELIVSQDTSYTVTKNYEATAIKTVTVPAGEFTAVEVRYDEIGSGDYGFDYYSSDAKYIIRSLGYSKGQIVSSAELQTLNFK